MHDSHDETGHDGGRYDAHASRGSDRRSDRRGLRRRTVLGGLAGLGVLGAGASTGVVADERTMPSRMTDRTPTGTGSYHPGQPLFVSVGEKLWNTAWTGPEYIDDRDNLAPGIPTPSADPENYAADDFVWSVVDAPADSEVELTYGSSLFADRPRYDEGRNNVAEFAADVPGIYRLELDAPDGTHRLTIVALPEADSADGGPPRLELDAVVEDRTVRVETNARLASDAPASPADLRAHVLVDDRDALDTADVAVDGTTATVDLSDLDGESARIHAVVHDGNRRSVADSVEIGPDGDVSLPNRPPEWIEEGVMYQIFTRSWAGERGATTFDTLIDGTVDGEPSVARGVDYLDELGIDVVWLTPVHPAVSAVRDRPGGGPHGYDITDYFGVAPDLAPEGVDPLDAYEAFVDACHERDIRVCLDLVVNHCGRSMPEFQATVASQTDTPEYWPTVESWNRSAREFDWFDRIDVPRTIDGETVDPAPSPTGFWNLRLHPNFNFDNVALREYMLAVADFWSGDVGVDGFRCDIAWGVPHSFWKDVREVCRANDGEFLLLDEAIPNDPAFSANEFDMHFDTSGFTVPAHDVANGEAEPSVLFDAIRSRTRRGFPDHSLLLNAIENHDERRTLNQAFDGTRDDPRKAQRATWAAGVTLPGVPHVYYGQERAISAFGEGRHGGPNDPRDGDVRSGGKQRAFMNWTEYDEDHLAFYRALIEAYHDLDVLKPRAALSGAWHNATTGEALVFGRDASMLDDVDGPERVVVLINLAADAAEVFLRPGVGATDLVSGADVSVETRSNARAVEVDTVAVLETPDLLEIGDAVADLAVDSGTDYGPGGYEYPTGEAYADGAFDLDEFSVHETPDAIQFRARVDGDLENPWDLPAGFSVQHLQVYLRADGADGETGDGTSLPGTTDTREGVNAVLAKPHSHRVVVDGENGVRLENHAGDVVSEGRARTNEVSDAIIAELPKGEFPLDLETTGVAPLMTGYAPDAPGNVTPVNEAAGPDAFGGGRDDDANPNVIDLVVDVGEDRDAALAYAADTPAEIGYVPLVTPYEELAAYDEPTGEAPGPGTYVTPLGDAYYEGAWDLDELTVHESRDRVRFEFTFAEPLRNPWDLNAGFSHQLPQIYVVDPTTDDPATTDGRTATNVAFEAPYNYRVNVNPESGARIEDAAGDPVSGDVTVDAGEHTITVDVPRVPIGWDAERGVGFAAVVCPFDGFGDGGLRTIEAEAAEHVIGGGHDGNWDPRVMDMATPDGERRVDVLSDYDEDSPPVLPYITLGDLSRGDLVGDGSSEETANDDEGATDEATDDDGGSGEAEPDSDATDGEVPGLGVAAGAAGVGGAALAARRFASDTDRHRTSGDEAGSEETESDTTVDGDEE